MLLITKVQAEAGEPCNTHRVSDTQGLGLGLQGGSFLNVFFMKFH